MFEVVSLQHSVTAKIFLFLNCFNDFRGENFSTTQSQVIAMGGNRVHPHGGITDQRKALTVKALGMHGNKWIVKSFGDQLHFTELVLQPIFDISVKFSFIHG